MCGCIYSELESPEVRLQLSFEKIPENEPIKHIKKRKLRGKKRNKLIELEPNNDDDDGDVDMTDTQNTNTNHIHIDSTTIECSYSIDKERMLLVLNTQSIDKLKTLKTVGPAKAKAIIANRHFKDVCSSVFVLVYLFCLCFTAR